MRPDEFRRYLKEVRQLGEGTISTRLSRCRRLEKYEGDLDEHFDRDEMDDLIDRLGRPPRHNVPIDGNPREGSDSLKTAAGSYRDFRRETDSPAGD